jgi:hypothetical protein
MLDIGVSVRNDLYNASNPLFKAVTELITGKEFFPNPENPRTMRDKWEYLFRQIGLNEEYRAIRGLPIFEGKYAKQKRSILWNNVSKGDAKLFDVYEMKREWLKENNIGSYYSQLDDPNSVQGKKAMAAYYYKQALKLQDKKAAERYLAEYVANGGTGKTFEATMKSMHPLFGMSKDNASAFVASLSPSEKTTYNAAVAYVSSLIQESSKR